MRALFSAIYRAGSCVWAVILSCGRLAAANLTRPSYLDSGSRRLVLRKRPPGELLPSAHMIDRGFRVQSTLKDAPVAVPKMVDFCVDPAVISTQIYIMERVDGRVIHDNPLPDIPKAGRKAYFEGLARMLSEIHNIDIGAVHYASWLMDTHGKRPSQTLVSEIMVAAARLQIQFLDRSIQDFGSAGHTPDTPLSFLWSWGRALRFIDGPDEVHLRGIARNELRHGAPTRRCFEWRSPR